MTREQAKQLWPVVKAWSEGETVEAKIPGGNWYAATMESIEHLSPCIEWRVKPTPKEFWVVVDSSGRPCNAYTDPKLVDPLYSTGNHTAIHCIEAL